MAVKIRLQRRGRKKRPFYHIVVADARAPRDGRFIEKLGTYNPMTSPATIDLDRDSAFDWLMKGAQPTDTARAILRFKGVLYRKHLMRGVKKGALTQEQADAKYQAWIDEKEAKVASRMSEKAAERRAYLAEISGTPPPTPTAEPVAEEDAPVAVVHKTLAEEIAAKSAAEAEALVAKTEVTSEVVEEAAPEVTEAPATEEAAATEPVAKNTDGEEGGEKAE